MTEALQTAHVWMGSIPSFTRYVGIAVVIGTLILYLQASRGKVH